MSARRRILVAFLATFLLAGCEPSDMRLPGEPKNVAAIYVTDMSETQWSHPENSPNAWIEARDAWFVIESDKVGGMGAAETVPFRNLSSAEAFAANFGGRVVPYADLPEDYVLSSH